MVWIQREAKMREIIPIMLFTTNSSSSTGTHCDEIHFYSLLLLRFDLCIE